MDSRNFNEALDMLRDEVVRVENEAHMVSGRIEILHHLAEAAKIEILKRRLEKRRRSLARQAGYNSIARDGRKLGLGLGIAAAGLILGGALSQDKLIALRAGKSGFDAVARGCGETTWAVFLGKDLTILPKNNITTGKIWVSWDSLQNTLAQLQREASQGVELGNLDSIIARLQRRKELVYLRPSETRRWVKVEEP